MDASEKWVEVKRAWAIWNLLDELQERLWIRYENEFLELTEDVTTLTAQQSPVKILKA